jgi:hypothetical protein
MPTSDYADFFAAGRDALLEGRTTYDLPMTDGSPRWGAAAVLRPVGPVLRRLADLARSAGAVAVARGGHWVHGEECLHVTLRGLEPYRSVIPADDPLRRAYADALREAAEGLPPVQVELRGVSPHAGGVLACGHPVDDTLEVLRKRFAHGLAIRGVRDLERGRVRDRWYVSLVHFARPVTAPEEIVRWCEERAALPIGIAELPAAEITQAVHTGTGIRLDTLEHVPLRQEPAQTPQAR